MSDSDRSIPPLDEHLKSIDVNKTRMAKIYDHLLGQAIAVSETAGRERPTTKSLPEVMSWMASFVTLLSATSAYPELPNRKRLIELVEAAMPQPVRHETTEAKP